MESIPLSRREILFISRQLKITPLQLHDFLLAKPEGISGREIYIELIHEVFAARDSRKFIQAAFPIPELKVDIQDFMNHESFKIELTSEILKLEKRFEAIQLRQQSMVPFWLTRPPIIY